MTVTTEYWYKTLLRLKLRQSSGDAFQDFFSRAMQKWHGDDFVRVRAFGQKGDKGCDGYLLSTGQLYQCYGALNGDKNKVDYLIKKMDDDFGTAKAKLSAIMKEWHMVHNLVDGLPIEAVETLTKLKQNNPGILFGFMGLEGFEQLIVKLNDQQLDDLLGPAATNKEAQELQVAELSNLVAGIVAATAAKTASDPQPITPVPADKLKANSLPEHWRQLISGGWQNAHVVDSYFDQHPDPLIGEAIASMFNDRYQYLRTQSLAPASIMDSLYEFVTGTGSVATARQVAAQALLAYLFESCDIFENVSVGVES